MSSPAGELSIAPAGTGNCLHLMLSERRDALRQCLDCCAAEDSVVLLGTAVTWLARPANDLWPNAGKRLFFLSEDVQAHGLIHLVERQGLNQIDERGLVELVLRHRHCLSWK